MKHYINEAKRLQELAGLTQEDQSNTLEDPNPLDDVPSVNLHIDDEGNMRLEVSAFYHTKDNGKIALLQNNEVLQDLLLKAIQIQAQKMFRNTVHSVLGMPYGLK